MPSRNVSSKVQHYRKLAEEFTARAVAVLGDRLKAVVLYGPLVKGKPPLDYDIPLVIVVEDDDYATHYQLADIGTAIAEASGWEPWFRLSTHTPAGLASSLAAQYPPVVEAHQHGVVLYDAAGATANSRDARAAG